MFKIATWNVNSLRVRLPQVIDWLQNEQPDLIGLQELKLSDAEFPTEALKEIGYHTTCFGQKTYNGVAILSKTEMTDIVTGIPTFPDPQCRILTATVADVRFINVYVPNGQSVGSEKFIYKLEWFSHLRNYLTEILAQYPKTVIVGDFNVAPEDRDVYDPIGWQGNVLVSPPERAAFHELLELGFSDTFRLFEQATKSYSWWDYRGFAFQRNNGLRIDHILASPALALNCLRSWIDKTPRGNERPSDHTPVVSEFFI